MGKLRAEDPQRGYIRKITVLVVPLIAFIQSPLPGLCRFSLRIFSRAKLVRERMETWGILGFQLSEGSTDLSKLWEQEELPFLKPRGMAKMVAQTVGHLCPKRKGTTFSELLQFSFSLEMKASGELWSYQLWGDANLMGGSSVTFHSSLLCSDTHSALKDSTVIQTKSRKNNSHQNWTFGFQRKRNF